CGAGERPPPRPGGGRIHRGPCARSRVPGGTQRGTGVDVPALGRGGWPDPTCVAQWAASADGRPPRGTGRRPGGTRRPSPLRPDSFATPRPRRPGRNTLLTSRVACLVRPLV